MFKKYNLCDILMIKMWLKFYLKVILKTTLSCFPGENASDCTTSYYSEYDPFDYLYSGGTQYSDPVYEAVNKIDRTPISPGKCFVVTSFCDVTVFILLILHSIVKFYAYFGRLIYLQLM